MILVFWHNDSPREIELATAVAAGAAVHGDHVVLRHKAEFTTDVFEAACMVGVKSLEMFRACKAAGVGVLYFDKGYTRQRRADSRTWEYWRVAVNDHQPTDYLMSVKRPDDRLLRSKLRIRPAMTGGEHIVFAGSSEKYHDFYGLGDPTSYAQKMAKRISKATGRRVVYRPKPSWKDAVPIDAADFSAGEGIYEALSGAHALVTHGSNACFEAILCGVPCVILGNAVARPLSSTEIEDADSPKMPADSDRYQWLSNLMYCQWKSEEFASGEAWRYIKERL